MVRVVVTGASGYLGQHLLAALAKDGLVGSVVAVYGSMPDFVAPCDTRSLDLSDDGACASLAALEPDVVVHLAAMSSPAACEQDVDRARAINCPTPLLDALPPDLPFIFLSTDQARRPRPSSLSWRHRVPACVARPRQRLRHRAARNSHRPRAQVYDGQTDGAAAPYTESSAASPVNAYGRTKLNFEQALAERRHAVVLRSSLILGPPTPEKCRKQSFLQVNSLRFI